MTQIRISYTHDGSETSSDSFTYEVCDDGSPQLCDTATVNITITAQNDAPVITGQDPLSTAEETSLTITLNDLTVTDPDDTYPADFTLSVQNGANYSRSGNTITPATNFNGELTVPVTVNDGTTNSPVFNLTVTVTGINDQPVITGQVPLSTPEETSLTISLNDLTVTDPDDTYPADFTLSVQNGANYSRSGNTITPANNFNGDLSVPVTVTDSSGEANATSAVFNLTVSVTGINDQPVITGQGTINTLEITAREILLTDLIVTDPDNAYPADFTLVVQDGTDYTRVGNVITPDTDFNGDLSVPVTVTDNSGEANATSAVFNLTVGVIAVNNQPQIINQLPLSTPEETALTIVVTDLEIVDADSTFPDDFTLTVLDGIDYTRVGNTITPATDFIEILTVPVMVNDGTDDSPVFNLTVTVTAVNDQPVITGQNVVTTPEITEREILLTDLIVTDPDNVYPADFTLAVQDGADYSRVGNTITPATDFNGDLSVPVTVTDNSGEANATSAVFNLVVSVSAVNNQPVITGQLPLTTPEDTALEITLDDLLVTDADNPDYPVGFTLTVLDGTDYTRVDNTITPNLNFNSVVDGDLTVPVTVNDGEADSPVFNLVVTVTPVNDAPVIVDQAVLTTPEDTSLTVVITDVTVADPDNLFPDDFTLELFDGADYTRAANTITPTLNFNGQLSVPATVSDGELTSAQFILTIDVSAENDQPVLEIPIEDQLAIEGTAFTLDISGNFTDADGDPLQFTATGLPASGNLVFDPVTGVISGTPQVEDARDTDPYIIIITVTDGDPDTIPATDEFNLNISALDRANVSLEISVAPDPAMLNDELTWTLTASNTVGPQIASNVGLTGSFVGSGLNISSTSSCTIQATVDQVTEFDCTIGSLAIPDHGNQCRGRRRRIRNRSEHRSFTARPEPGR
jgi:SHS2 domain-containing protein